MTLIQKMLKNNDITPTSDAGNNGGNNGQPGPNSSAAGENLEDDAELNGAAKPEAGKEGADAKPGAAGGGGAPAGENNNNGGGSPQAADLTDEAIIEGLRKKGFEVNNLEDLRKPVVVPELTPGEKAEAQRRRLNEIRAFALQSNKVTTTQLDAYARESTMDPVELSYAVFKREKLEELTNANTPADQMPADKDIRAEFDELNFLYAEEADPKRKTALKRLEREADNYLQETYPAIYDMETDYDAHTGSQAQRIAYNSTINTIFTELGTEIPYSIPGDKPGEVFSYNVKFKDDEIAAIRSVYESDDLFRNLGNSQADKAKITEGVMNTLFAKHRMKITAEVARAHADALVIASKKGRRNIPVTTQQGQEALGSKTVTPLVGKMLKNTGVIQ